jgi:hypothetical protein
MVATSPLGWAASIKETPTAVSRGGRISRNCSMVDGSNWSNRTVAPAARKE